MFDSSDSALLLLLLPALVVLGIALNLFIRARGGRSFKMRLKGLGIDLLIESTGSTVNAAETENGD